MTSPYKRSSHLVDAVASNSRWVRDRHIRLGYFSRVPAKVVYNIANLAEIGQTARLEQGDMVFGFIGRIEPEKGIDVVLRAARRLPATGWRLRIAGIGVADYVDALKAGNRDERIEWLGFLPSQDFYKSIDVCLISSDLARTPATDTDRKHRRRPRDDLFDCRRHPRNFHAVGAGRRLRADRRQPVGVADAKGNGRRAALESGAPHV